MGFLQQLSEQRGWSGREAGLNQPLRPTSLGYQPTCSCSPAEQQPQADLNAKTIKCGHCRLEIPSSCKRRAVGHLRMLLELPDGCRDEADMADAGLLFQ